MLRIISFHVTDDRWEKKPHAVGGKKVLAAELIPLFAESVRKSNSEASFEIITDQRSNFTVDFDKIWRFDIDPEYVMLERARAQEQVLHEAHENDLIAFLDTDILVLSNLRNIFKFDFDVGITIRDNPIHAFEKRMPYNNGVIFAKCNSSYSYTYFRKIRSAIEKLDKSLWAWSGNQFVVRDYVGRQLPNKNVVIDGTKVRIFPCSQYNYAPESANEDVSGKHILHFRGEAKSAMSGYYTKLIMSKS